MKRGALSLLLCGLPLAVGLGKLPSGRTATSCEANAVPPPTTGCESYLLVEQQNGIQGQIFLYIFRVYYSMLQEWAAPRDLSKLKKICSDLISDYTTTVCPEATGVCRLFQAESIIMAILPLASAETPDEILKTEMNAVDNIMSLASLIRKHNAGDPDGLLLLELGRDRVAGFAELVTKAMTEQWDGPRAWVLNKFAWASFNRLSRVNIVPLKATPDYFESVFGSARKDLRGTSEAAVRQGWKDVTAAIREVSSADLEWWPAMGTLIGFLRYGELHGQLSNGKVDLVDDDLDIMVVQPTARDWLNFCLKITDKLLSRGWLGCAHLLQRRLDNRTALVAKHGVHMRGTALLYCAKLGKLKSKAGTGEEFGDVILNLQWVRPVKLLPEDTQSGHGGYCEEAARRWGTRQGVRRLQCGGRVQLTTEPGAAVTEELLCHPEGLETGAATCWSTSLYFPQWPGAVLPAEERLPLARCQAFGSPVPCPRRSAEVLRRWGQGEYWRPSSSQEVLQGMGASQSWPCLALPDVACPDPSEGTFSWRVDRQSDDHRNKRLHAEGLTLEDFILLKSHQRRLRRRGLLAHNFTGCDWRRCERPRL